MSHLLEYRKVNDTQFPLYFKFDTIPSKSDLTTDKYMSMDNWISMFAQLDEILIAGSNASKKLNSSFDLENGRLTVKTKWLKVSDDTLMGNYTLKYKHLSSTNAAKYFLKIGVRLHSNFDRLVTQLEHEKKVLVEKCKLNNESNGKEHIKTEVENSDVKVVLKDIQKIKKKEANPLPSPVNTPEEIETYDILDANNVEEYIPTPSTASSAIENGPTYQPQKNSEQIEINQMQSQYSPTYVSADKPPEEQASYKPSTRSRREVLKSAENGDAKKILSKRNRARSISANLFGSSDDDNLGDLVSSSSHSPDKSKRKKKSSSKRDSKLTKHADKRKKTVDIYETSGELELQKIGDITIRTLKNESIEDILATFSEHRAHLTELYSSHIKHFKRNYRPKDIPPLAIEDILTTEQQDAMTKLLTDKLVSDPEKYHYYLDVLFDAILPEWAFILFCSKFNCTRPEALERLHLQASVLIAHNSDSEL